MSTTPSTAEREQEARDRRDHTHKPGDRVYDIRGGELATVYDVHSDTRMIVRYDDEPDTLVSVVSDYFATVVKQ